MTQWEMRVLEQRVEKKFHTLRFPEDFEYINDLYKWSLQAAKKCGSSILGHSGALDQGAYT
jgi:hypothetical protein